MGFLYRSPDDVIELRAADVARCTLPACKTMLLLLLFLFIIIIFLLLYFFIYYLLLFLIRHGACLTRSSLGLKIGFGLKSALVGQMVAILIGD